MSTSKAEPGKSDMASANSGKVVKRRTSLMQSDVPAFSLEQALRVPRAIGDSYAYKPAKPMNIAAAMNMLPSSTSFRQRCGAAVAFGLITASFSAPEIGITHLGLRIVRPLEEGEELPAKREAVMKPRVIREFLEHYNNAPLPKDNIARNVLVDMGVPVDRMNDVFELIIESADVVGFIRQIKDKRYIDLSGAAYSHITSSEDETSESSLFSSAPRSDISQAGAETAYSIPASVHLPEALLVPQPTIAQPEADRHRRRVFVTHGKNQAFVEPIKKLLAFGELEPVVSVERQSVSQPVSDKVMNDMRGCGAAIIHVDAEQRLIDPEAKEQIVLNSNVLIEIGAALALYGKRFILLVKEGVQLPSNLQGLYEVRYNADVLDGDTTIRLLEAINAMKNYPMPSRYTSGEE